MSLASWRAASMTAAWTTAALRGQVGVEQALDVLAASDILRPVHVDGERDSLVHAIARWRRLGITGWWYAPVEPGDVFGVPDAVRQEALAAGSAVVSVDGAGRALLVHEGELVEQHVADHGRPPVESVSDAERHLLDIMVSATSALTGLDVAPWESVGATHLERPTDPMPPGAGLRAERLAARSLLVLELTEVALSDGGGSRTSFETERRADTLRDVRRAARQAHSVAWNTAVIRASPPR